MLLSLPRLSFAAAALALAALPSGPALAKDVDNSHLTAEQLDDLARVSRYLNALPTLRGRFLQITVEPEPEGLGGRSSEATGVFYMKRPGRLRFEYDPPVPIVFVADGTMVHIEDKKLENVNGYPLKSTPLGLLLRKDVDLAQQAQISAVKRLPGQLHVTARDEDGVAQGELTMIFSYPMLELRQWIAVDTNEVRTSVFLRDVEKNVKLNPALFRPTDYDFESTD
jgi:outer membrane lipoprotein-sorting protein